MTAKQWHIEKWSGLALVETAFKLVAHVVALIAVLNALSSGTASSPQGTRLAQVIVLAVISLLWTLAIVNRYQDHEIIAMGFILLHVAAHWAMVYALLTTPGPGILLLIFALLMLIGDLVKIRWLVVSGFTSQGVTTRTMVGAVSIFVVGYLILVVLALAGG